jgi:hypothetical protein
VVFTSAPYTRELQMDAFREVLRRSIREDQDDAATRRNGIGVRLLSALLGADP